MPYSSHIAHCPCYILSVPLGIIAHATNCPCQKLPMPHIAYVAYCPCHKLPMLHIACATLPSCQIIILVLLMLTAIMDWSRFSPRVSDISCQSCEMFLSMSCRWTLPFIGAQTNSLLPFTAGLGEMASCFQLVLLPGETGTSQAWNFGSSYQSGSRPVRRVNLKLSKYHMPPIMW